MRPIMILTGVIRLTTKLIGMRLSRREAWCEVRGNPSRMKEAVGAAEGKAGAASVTDDVEGIQELDLSSERMRRKIMSSGTREPDCM